MPVTVVLLNAAAAAALAAALLAAGARLRQLLRLPVPPRLRWPVDLALGAWLLALLVLLLGLAGLLGRGTMAGVVAGVAVCGRWRGAGRRWGVLVPPAVGGLLFLPVALGPPFFYDALVYHLALPWRALLDGAWQARPETVLAAYPPLAELLSVPTLAFGFTRVPALLQWLGWVAAGAGIIALARRLGAPPLAARLAGGAVLLLPVTPLVPGFPGAEGWLLIGLVPAVTLATDRARPGAPLLTGLLLGIAAAARLQGLPWTMVVMVLAALSWRPGVRAAAAAASGFVIGALPWWGANLALLGDPLAPLFWHREGLDTLWRDTLSHLRGGQSLAACLTAVPRMLAPHAAWLLPLVLLAALAVVQRTRRAAPLALASALGAAAWACTGALPRFLAPTVVLLLATATLPRRSRPVRAVAAVALAWVALLGALGGVAWLGRIDMPALLTWDLPKAVEMLSPNPPAKAFARATSLPRDARVLFVAEPRSFGFPRRCVVPSQHDPSPLRDLAEEGPTAAEMGRRLRRAGYTHLLVNWGELARLGRAYPVAPWRSDVGRRRWRELIGTLGEPVISEEGVQIFDLSPTRGHGASGG